MEILIVIAAIAKVLGTILPYLALAAFIIFGNAFVMANVILPRRVRHAACVSWETHRAEALARGERI